jgi:hypothetical protein
LARGEAKAPTTSAFTKATPDKATAAAMKKNEQKIRRNLPRVTVASACMPRDISLPNCSFVFITPYKGKKSGAFQEK